MAAHKGPASLRPRCTRSGSFVAAIPVYQSTSLPVPNRVCICLYINTDLHVCCFSCTKQLYWERILSENLQRTWVCGFGQKHLTYKRWHRLIRSSFSMLSAEPARHLCLVRYCFSQHVCTCWCHILLKGLGISNVYSVSCCFFEYLHFNFVSFRPAAWSSGQSFWLLNMRSRVRFPVLQWGFFLEWDRCPWWPWSG
jgi:hypothetical protein